MFINNENYQDAQKYYQGTYIKLAEKGDELFEVSTISKYEMLIRSVKTGKVLEIDMINGYDIDFQLPKKTVYQVDNYAFILYRIPAQQWKKGICAENTAFLYLNSQAKWIAATFHTQYLSLFTEKTPYFSLEEIKTMIELDHPNYSYALNSRMSVHRAGSLFIDTIKIGKVDWKNKSVYTQRIFATEVMTNLNYNNNFKLITHD